jgi:protoporphyrin/coproporphyrin ferrochelatase
MPESKGDLMSTAVLLMAYGGPDSLDDIEPYLLDVRSGRPTSPELVEEIRGRYAQIGGHSPLLQITRAQASRLEERLQTSSAAPIQVFVGMRHWHPYIASVVQDIAACQSSKIVAVCMAPYASRYSTGAYRAKLGDALKSLSEPLPVHFVESWHNHPLLIRSIVENIQAAQSQFPPQDRSAIYHLFSAHSLPASILDQGDPYPAQLQETAGLVAAQLGLHPEQWSLCYQSAGRIPGAWLGPQIDEVIPQLSRQGVRNLLVTAIGFVADHVEVLYDLDIEARVLAKNNGMTFGRTASPNTSPTFIEALAQIVTDSLSKENVQHENEF